MSNAWKLLGLGCLDNQYLQDIKLLNKTLTKEGLAVVLSTKDLERALRYVDNVLVKYKCPLGHLEAQNFYDQLFTPPVWSNLEDICGSRRFAPLTGDDPGGFRRGAYCTILGLACTDPWQDATSANKGFRDWLYNDGKPTPAAVRGAADKVGLFVDDEIAEKIATGLSADVMKSMGLISMCWERVTESNVTERSEYPRFTVWFPWGWSNRMAG